MPADQRCRLHNDQRLPPVEPARKPDQGETGSIRGTPRFDVALLVEGKLFPQKEVLRCQHRSWTQAEAQETDDIDQQCQQRARRCSP